MIFFSFENINVSKLPIHYATLGFLIGKRIDLQK